MKTITIDDIMNWEPCYSREEIECFFINCGFDSLSASPIEIAKCSHEKKEDLIWLLLREEIIPEKRLHMLACNFAEQALINERSAGREPHIDSWNAIKVKRLWIEGKATNEELKEAARAAVRAAVAWAARATWAAEAAAWAARAAWEARAARAAWAAEAAVRATAEAEIQLNMIIEVLKNETQNEKKK